MGIEESAPSIGMESTASDSGQVLPVVAHATGKQTETLTMQAETLNPPKTVAMETATQSVVPVRPKETVAIAVAASENPTKSVDAETILQLKLQLETSKRNEMAMAKERDEREAQIKEDKENENIAECANASATCKRKEVSFTMP